MMEWLFVGLGLVGFVALLRQVLIRRLAVQKRMASWVAAFLLPFMVCAVTVLTLLTEWSALNSGGGLAMLAFPPILAASLLIGAVGVGFSRLLDPASEIET